MLDQVDPRAIALMTMSSGFVEVIGPLLIMIIPISSRMRLMPILMMCGLHIGIQLCIYLPQFQSLSVIFSLVFLPSSCFSPLSSDVHSRSDKPGSNNQVREAATVTKSEHTEKHKPGNSTLRQRSTGQVGSDANEPRADHSAKPASQSRKTSIGRHANWCENQGWFVWLLTVFMLGYSIAHFGSEAFRLFKMPDGGNIGEIFRFRQTWRMYCPLQETNTWWVVTGTVSNDTVASTYDIFAGMRSKGWNQLKRDELIALENKPEEITSTFPNWRYERMFFHNHPVNRLAWFARHLCHQLATGIGIDRDALFAANARIHYRSWTYKTKLWRVESIWKPNPLPIPRYTAPLLHTDLTFDCSEVFNLHERYLKAR
jgi:hypothetical protein